MGRLTPDEFRAKYAELPQNLREAYGSLDTTKIIQEIGKKHGLLMDQIGELVNETGFLMLGATQPGDYIGKISAAAGIPREKAKEVATEVNEQVFKPIRDALKRVHRVGEYEHSKGDALKQPAPSEVPRKESELPPQTHTLADDIRQVTNAPSERAPKAIPRTEPTPQPTFSSPPENLSEERLTKTFSLPHKEKSYTISENGEEETAPTHQYQMDPYREPVDN